MIFVKFDVAVDEVSSGIFGTDTFMAVKLAFRFLRMSMCSHQVNQCILNKYSDFLSKREILSSDFGVVDTMAEMYKGNFGILDQVSDGTMEEMTTLLKELHHDGYRGARFVDLLRTLCKCEDTPVPANQNRICDLFLKDPSMLLAVCYEDHIIKSSVQKKKSKNKEEEGESSLPAIIPHIRGYDNVVNGGTEPADWIPLTMFSGKTAAILAKPLSACTVEEKIYRYQIQSLRLFIAGCSGRNRYVTDYLLTMAGTLGLAYDQLLQVVSCNGLPPFYRAIHSNSSSVASRATSTLISKLSVSPTRG